MKELLKEEIIKIIRAHCNDRDGILKKQKDSSGKVIRGKYVLKSQYILLSDDKKEQKEVGNWDFWKI